MARSPASSPDSAPHGPPPLRGQPSHRDAASAGRSRGGRKDRFHSHRIAAALYRAHDCHAYPERYSEHPSGRSMISDAGLVMTGASRGDSGVVPPCNPRIGICGQIGPGFLEQFARARWGPSGLKSVERIDGVSSQLGDDRGHGRSCDKLDGQGHARDRQPLPANQAFNGRGIQHTSRKIYRLGPEIKAFRIKNYRYQ